MNNLAQELATQDNIFGFEYQETTINNLDGTESRFSYVIGDKGNVMHCKKAGYEIITTESISSLASAFNEAGHNVKSFSHRDGEVIGLDIQLQGGKLTKVGDKKYNAIITIPNNGNGRGFLTIHEVRLVCSNGMTRKSVLFAKGNSVKIPHRFDYAYSLDLMKSTTLHFLEIIKEIEDYDTKLDSLHIDRHQAMKHLNEWFYAEEMPAGHKKDITSCDMFRELLVTDRDQIKSIARYDELMLAFEKETHYNKALGLELSMYTVLATLTNYVTRRQESSNSGAPKQVQDARNAKKLDFIYDLVPVGAEN